MADVYCVINRTVKLADRTQKISLNEPLAYDNALAHAIRVTAVQEDGTPEDLTGVGVVGSFMKADGNTVTPINGTVSGNVAEIILPASCYVTPGRFKCTMNLSKSGATRTVLWVEGHVERNVGGTIIDPGTPVGNISTAISNANAAASAATSAATAASAAAQTANGFAEGIAPTFEEVMATSPFVELGAYEQHCWYNGQLYVNKVAISAAEAWNAAHWQAVDISGELYKCPKWDGTSWTNLVATASDVTTYLNIT